jgi:hypothetical protein
MTATGNYVADTSTLANFKSWAQAISSALAAFGWIQSNDTGQVVWTASSAPISAVAVSGGNTIFTYNATTATGPVLRVGMSITTTSCGTSNNVTANITALGGSGAAATFTVVNAGSVQASVTGTGTTTALAAVPSSAYVYEVWSANDSQAATLPIFLKMEYGNATTTVGIRVTVGTSSNGTGTITGSVSFNAQILTNGAGTFATQGVTAYPCYFSGDAGEFRMLMWVTNATAGVTTMFGIERSKDATGVKTAEYFTALNLNSASLTYSKQSTTVATAGVVGVESSILAVPCQTTASGGSAFFNGTVAAFPIFPALGKVGNPMLGFMACTAGDVGDNTSVTVTSMYGGTHAFVACKSGAVAAGFQSFAKAPLQGNNSALLMRYE